jgi:hypothetical protein
MNPININTIRAFINDEINASREYARKAKEVGVGTPEGRYLITMSRDEARHHDFWIDFLKKVEKMRR